MSMAPCGLPITTTTYLIYGFRVCLCHVLYVHGSLWTAVRVVSMRPQPTLYMASGFVSATSSMSMPPCGLPITTTTYLIYGFRVCLCHVLYVHGSLWTANNDHNLPYIYGFRVCLCHVLYVHGSLWTANNDHNLPYIWLQGLSLPRHLCPCPPVDCQ